MFMLADSPKTRAWFIDDFVPEILQLVISVWETFTRDHPSLRLETRITNSFSHALVRAYEEQGKRWYVFPEMQRTDPITGREIARHDIRFFHRDVSGQSLYFVFECKRLNILNKRGVVVPNSAGYKAGIMKFVNNTYGAGHPCGGMIGYVMDGNLGSALITIKKVIEKNRQSLWLTPDGDYAASSLMSKHAERGETKHQRADGGFVIHHLLLPRN